MEQPGPSVRQGLVRSDPLPRGSCGRHLCPWAKTEEQCKMRCYREGVGYVGRCRRCYERQVGEEGREEQDVVLETYQGESSRSVVTRARSHYQAYIQAMRKKPRLCRTTPGGRSRRRRRVVAGWRTIPNPIMTE